MPANVTTHVFAAAPEAFIMVGRKRVTGGVKCNGRWLLEPSTQVCVGVCGCVGV